MTLVRPPRTNEETTDARDAWRRRVADYGTLPPSHCTRCNERVSPLVCQCARRVFVDAYMHDHWPVDTTFVDAIVDDVLAEFAGDQPADYDVIAVKARARAYARRAVSVETRATLTELARETSGLLPNTAT